MASVSPFTLELLSQWALINDRPPVADEIAGPVDALRHRATKPRPLVDGQLFLVVSKPMAGLNDHHWNPYRLDL
jgi:hypothetical protein